MLTVENTWTEIAAAGVDTAILPIGSIEQHGHHLPLATDWIFAEDFAKRLAERMGNVLLLPGMPYGCSWEHMALPGTVTLRATTLAAVIEDVAESLRHHGLKYCVVCSGHGGNWIIKPAIREINFRYKGEFFCLWGGGPIVDEGEKAPQDLHAGFWETSQMLLLRPELVKDHKNQPDSPAIVGQEFLDYLGFDMVTKRGAWGAPATADPESIKDEQDKGAAHAARYIEWVKRRIEELKAEGGCRNG